MIKPHHRLYISVFLFDLSIVAGTAVSPFYMFHFFGGGPAMSGTVIGAQWGAYALTALVSARYVSKTQNGLIWALIGGLGFSILFPLAAVSRSPYVFGIMTALAMAATGLFWPAMQAWIGAEPDRRLRLRRMSHYNLAWTIGLTSAPPIAGALYGIDYRLAFALVFLTGIAGTLLAATLPHESRHFAASAAEVAPFDVIHAARSEEHLYAAWFSLLVGCALVMSMAAVFCKRVEDIVEAGRLVWWLGADSAPLAGKGVVLFAWLTFVMYAARAAASLVMGWSHVWQHRFWLLAAVQLMGGLASLVMALSYSYVVLLAGSFFVGSVAGVCFFASQTYSVVDPALKHRRLAIHEGMVGIGSLMGAIGFGLLAERFGIAWPFIWTPAAVAACIGVEIALLIAGQRRISRKKKAEEVLTL